MLFTRVKNIGDNRLIGFSLMLGLFVSQSQSEEQVEAYPYKALTVCLATFQHWRFSLKVTPDALYS